MLCVFICKYTHMYILIYNLKLLYELRSRVLHYMKNLISPCVLGFRYIFCAVPIILLSFLTMYKYNI